MEPFVQRHTPLQAVSSTLLAVCVQLHVMCLIVTGDGEVYLWDVGKRACINRFVDSGSLRGTALAVSSDGKYNAVGYVSPLSARTVLTCTYCTEARVVLSTSTTLQRCTHSVRRSQ